MERAYRKPLGSTTCVMRVFLLAIVVESHEVAIRNQ